MLLLAGSGRLMVLDFEPSSADFPPTPAGVPTATCVGCGLTIHQRPDGVWLLEGPPWWCYPDRELIGVLAQNHTPLANPPDVGGGDQVTATLYPLVRPPRRPRRRPALHRPDRRSPAAALGPPQ